MSVSCQDELLKTKKIFGVFTDVNLCCAADELFMAWLWMGDNADIARRLPGVERGCCKIKPIRS